MNINGTGFSAAVTKSRGVAIPIPAPVPRKCANVSHASSSDFFSSSEGSTTTDSSEEDDSPPLGDFTRLSSSHQDFQSSSVNNTPLNVYGTSPRTSVMFHYYNSPKSFYNRPHHPLIRTRSTDAPQTCRPVVHRNIDFSKTNLDKNCNNENTALVKHAKPTGISAQHFSQLDDARPRAWSESDKSRSGNASSIQNSRMSALRKLKMKLGQKGGLKRQKTREEDVKNRSAASITSLEKVEEGRQLECTPTVSLHVSALDRASSPNKPSVLHQEHETRKKTERRVGVVKYSGMTPHILPQVKENPEDYLIYQRFLEEHTCYDLMPTSSKLVILDTRLEVRKAFHALVENSLRCAPLWDSESNDYVGLLTVSDFVNILLAYHNCPNKKLEDLETQKISCWRKVLNSQKSLIHVPPWFSISDALKTLTEENIRRLAIVNPMNGDIFHVINHRRILHFLHLFMNELPKPDYMKKTVRELGIGTQEGVATISEDSPVIDALNLIATHKISGLPVIDKLGHVSDVFTKTDVLVLAGEKLFYDLTIKIKDVISLHSTVDVDEKKPTVIRTMPGSPALVRRKNQGKQSQPQSSTPAPQLSSHPFLRNSNNGAKNVPSPLVTSSSGSSSSSNSVTEQHGRDRSNRHSTGSSHYGGQMAFMKELTHDKGDASNVLSPPSTQPLLHRRRHLSSHLPRSSSISSHLVTVTQEDTLESVVNSVVTADVLQAVLVDEWDHVKGVISVGDILRFMVYPTKNGEICKNGLSPSSLSPRGNSSDMKPLAGRLQRTRAISDDTDIASIDRSRFRSEIGKVSTRASSPPHSRPISGGYSALPTSPNRRVQAGISNPVYDPPTECLEDFSSLSLKNTPGDPGRQRKKVVGSISPAQILASGEEIKRL